MSAEKSEETSEEVQDASESTLNEGKGIPPHMRQGFASHEAALALKPGFRNPGNKGSKVQKRKKKGRRS